MSAAIAIYHKSGLLRYTVPLVVEGDHVDYDRSGYPLLRCKVVKIGPTHMTLVRVDNPASKGERNFRIPIGSRQFRKHYEKRGS